MTWAESDIPDLASKTIVVTGANSGVGFEASKLLARHSAQIILACRNKTKMADAADSIIRDTPNASLIQLQLDVSDLDSVHAFAEALGNVVSKVDVLLLNAGAAFMEYQTSAQGIELMFATNHLGHFLLTGLLLPLMKDVTGSRVVAVSSIAHSFTHDINYAIVRGDKSEDFSYFKGYSETKLANQWFVRELQRRLSASGAKTIAVACHPGAAATDITRHTHGNWVAKLMTWFFIPFQHTAREGALSLVMAIADESVGEGCYCGPGNWGSLNGRPIKDAKISKTVFDEEKAKELWTVSEELSGFAYPI